MSMIYCLGIDPGQTGALALLKPDDTVEFHDMPTLSIQGGKKNKTVIHEDGLVAILKEIKEKLPLVSTLECAVERVQAFPAQRKGAAPCPVCKRGPAAQGVVSMFGFGEGFGIIKGVLATLGIKREFISPQTWKSIMMPGQGHEKDASRQVAMRLFPKAAKDMMLKKHHGRADALLLAAFARRTRWS